ncbi:unnamed protein product [Calypogeia fissa]
MRILYSSNCNSRPLKDVSLRGQSGTSRLDDSWPSEPAKLGDALKGTADCRVLTLSLNTNLNLGMIRVVGAFLKFALQDRLEGICNLELMVIE